MLRVLAALAAALAAESAMAGPADYVFMPSVTYGEREGTHSFYDAIEWENKFQLTETGRYPVDAGFIMEFELPHDRSESNDFRFGPLFQTEFDQVQVNFNTLLTNTPRSVEENGTYLGYQWQVKYRWHQALEFGAQGFGDMGVCPDAGGIRILTGVAPARRRLRRACE
jgi:hypothetical protein